MFQAPVIKYLMVNMPDQVDNLPIRCWLENFPKDLEIEIKEDGSQNLLAYLPPQALFLMSINQEHKNNLLWKPF